MVLRKLADFLHTEYTIGSVYESEYLPIPETIPTGTLFTPAWFSPDFIFVFGHLYHYLKNDLGKALILQVQAEKKQKIQRFETTIDMKGNRIW
jgi:hypothetical protein